jgi:hypothetical protein
VAQVESAKKSKIEQTVKTSGPIIQQLQKTAIKEEKNHKNKKNSSAAVPSKSQVKSDLIPEELTIHFSPLDKMLLSTFNRTPEN